MSGIRIPVFGSKTTSPAQVPTGLIAYAATEHVRIPSAPGKHLLNSHPYLHVHFRLAKDKQAIPDKQRLRLNLIASFVFALPLRQIDVLAARCKPDLTPDVYVRNHREDLIGQFPAQALGVLNCPVDAKSAGEYIALERFASPLGMSLGIISWMSIAIF
ncbi:MAG: hypothetical protein SVV80_01325 [Planctomycetota bacterium]|nr:hypothetical protein [Planctomycetota bacterium]